jgi:hypothetical protein
MRLTACVPCPLRFRTSLLACFYRWPARSNPVIQLTAQERADLRDADAEIARDEFATDEHIRSMLAKRTV